METASPISDQPMSTSQQDRMAHSTAAMIVTASARSMKV